MHRHGDGALAEVPSRCGVGNPRLNDYHYKVGVGWLISCVRRASLIFYAAIITSSLREIMFSTLTDL